MVSRSEANGNVRIVNVKDLTEGCIVEVADPRVGLDQIVGLDGPSVDTDSAPGLLH